jgi:hypothetical protein
MNAQIIFHFFVAECAVFICCWSRCLHAPSLLHSQVALLNKHCIQLLNVWLFYALLPAIRSAHLL